MLYVAPLASTYAEPDADGQVGAVVTDADAVDDCETVDEEDETEEVLLAALEALLEGTTAS